MKKIRLRRTRDARISARCDCDRSVILYLVEDPQELKQIRIERSRLQHPPSRRPLRAGGPVLVPAGVWAVSPAGLYTLIPSDRRRPWVGSRGLGRAPPGSTPGIQPGKRLRTLPLRQSPLTLARKLTWLHLIVFTFHSDSETRGNEREGRVVRRDKWLTESRERVLSARLFMESVWTRRASGLNHLPLQRGV